MFSGHFLTGKNAVIYVEEDPFFTTTLLQMWNCRGLVYLFFDGHFPPLCSRTVTRLTGFFCQSFYQTLSMSTAPLLPQHSHWI
jgi:hypothetical protein